jgi:hypothetical protein
VRWTSATATISGAGDVLDAYEPAAASDEMLVAGGTRAEVSGAGDYLESGPRPDSLGRVDEAPMTRNRAVEEARSVLPTAGYTKPAAIRYHASIDVPPGCASAGYA